MLLMTPSSYTTEQNEWNRDCRHGNEESIYIFLKFEMEDIMSCSYGADNNRRERENANDGGKRKEILRSFSKTWQEIDL